MKWISTLVLCLMCVGCTAPTQHFQNITTHMSFTLHVVPSRDMLPIAAQAISPRVVGCAYPGNIIYVIGEQRDYGIYINPEMLGHEMMHLLTWQHPGTFCDPHVCSSPFIR